MCIRDSTCTEPEVGLSTPPRMCSNVDLPLPDGPTMETNSPRSVSYTHLDVYKRQDEPTGNLDTKNSAAIVELLKTFHKKYAQTLILKMCIRDSCCTRNSHSGCCPSTLP